MSRGGSHGIRNRTRRDLPGLPVHQVRMEGSLLIMAQRVKVSGAPGLVDFEGTLVPGLGHVEAVDQRGELAVVWDEEMVAHVVPSENVEELN